MQSLISIIIPTRNNQDLLPSCLEGLRKQTYKNLEILVVDGQSTDNTLHIAQEFNAKIINNPDLLAEPAVNLGMLKAQGELSMIIAVDNIYKDPRAIEKIAACFDDKEMYAAFPKHDSDETDNVFSHYINTFTDPFNHFVYGDAANARTFKKMYKTITHTDIYDVYDYKSSETKPMIAFAQGFTIRRGYMRPQADAFDDCKPILDLIAEGKKIAYVHSVSLFHHTIRDLDHFMRKQRWATQNALQNLHYGIAYRQETLSAVQKFKKKIWPLYAFSIIAPAIRGLFGFIIDRELMWLLHPFMCFLSAYASLTQVIMYNSKKHSTISRQ